MPAKTSAPTLTRQTWSASGPKDLVEQAVADAHDLPYTFIAAWITCTIEAALGRPAGAAGFDRPPETLEC
jgi:hypothetical protein